MLQAISNWYRINRNILIISLGVGFFITMAAGLASKSYSDTMQAGMADGVIRFHVLANSDAKEDQALKIKVRDELLSQFSKELNTASDLAQARQIINGKLSEIERCAEETVRREGYGYDVTAALTTSVFPAKQYANLTFVPGEYEALKVVIGEGKGANWFCVMFPPLCFVDESHSEVSPEMEDALKTVMPEEAYELVTQAADEENVSVQIKFKIVEWWQEQRYAYAMSKNPETRKKFAADTVSAPANQ